MERIEILELLRRFLKPNRYLHTLSAEKQAIALARQYDADEKKAALAALLHDCAKNFTPEQREKYLSAIDEDSRSIEPVLHAPMSALVAKEVFGVTDPEILAAIRFHTTGCENMSLLEKVLFVADAIEPLRNYPGVEELRELARTSLDATIAKSLMNTLQYNEGKKIHSDSVKALNYLLKQGV